MIHSKFYLVLSLTFISLAGCSAEQQVSNNNSGEEKALREVASWLIEQDAVVGRREGIGSALEFSARQRKLSGVWKAVVDRHWEEKVFEIFLGKLGPNPARLIAAKLAIAYHKNKHSRQRVLQEIENDNIIGEGAMEALYLLHSSENLENVLRTGSVLIKQSPDGHISRKIGALLCSFSTLLDLEDTFGSQARSFQGDLPNEWGQLVGKPITTLILKKNLRFNLSKDRQRSRFDRVVDTFFELTWGEGLSTVLLEGSDFFGSWDGNEFGKIKFLFHPNRFIN